MVFDYPRSSTTRPPTSSPPSAASQGVVSAWFLSAGARRGAACPGRDRRRRPERRRRPCGSPLPVGVAAAAVQVIGVLRWPAPGAPLGRPQGTIQSERLHHAPPTRCWATSSARPIGYLLTAAWTGLVLVAPAAGHRGSSRRRSAAHAAAPHPCRVARRWRCRSSTSTASSLRAVEHLVADLRGRARAPGARPAQPTLSTLRAGVNGSATPME